MEKKTAPAISNANAAGKRSASPVTTRVISPFKNKGFGDRILSSDDGNAFSKYALLRPKGNGGFERVGGDMKEKKG